MEQDKIEWMDAWMNGYTQEEEEQEEEDFIFLSEMTVMSNEESRVA